jgi:peptidoglycan/LPS O-acetylase OafA/YrhL
LALTHFRLEVPIRDFVEQVASWLLFTIPGYPPINGFKATILVNTVFWSLVYEWKFYLVLPFIAALAAVGRPWIAAVGVGLCIALFSQSQIEWLFVAGCIAAYVVRLESVRTWLIRPAASIAALASIAATARFHPLAYNTLGAILLFFPFLVFAAGNSLFGALTCRPARVLGLLSYSVYLLHNWLLYLVSRLVNHFTPVADLSAGLYWILGLVVAVVTVSLSAFTYRFIEFPGMHRRGTPHARRLAANTKSNSS